MRRERRLSFSTKFGVFVWVVLASAVIYDRIQNAPPNGPLICSLFVLTLLLLARPDQ